MEKRKIVRTYSAGVFFAEIDYVGQEKRAEDHLILKNARRIWYWDGAASLSQLAVDGTKKPENCKFPVAVEMIEVFGVIEILSVTEAAAASIDGVKIWSR
jgi:hypothetical protein